MIEAALTKLKFQAFIFVVVVLLIFAGILDKNMALGEEIVSYMFWLAIAGLGVFVMSLVLTVSRRDSVRDESEEAEESSVSVPSWPNEEEIGIARGFMLLGAIVYIGYHFLDRYVVSQETSIEILLYLRLVVTSVVLAVWILSFRPWFIRYYVHFVGGALYLAGTGVAAMLYISGPDVHFYYEGFIQVIAFAAFAFRIPPKHLARLCVVMLLLYAGLVFEEVWIKSDISLLSPQRQAILINNVVSLVTFVILALTASIALAKTLTTRRDHT